MKTLTVLALVLVGCVSEAYSALPQREQDRFQRCNNTLIAAQCAPGGDAGLIAGLLEWARERTPREPR